MILERINALKDKTVAAGLEPRELHVSQLTYAALYLEIERGLPLGKRLSPDVRLTALGMKVVVDNDRPDDNMIIVGHIPEKKG